MGRWAFLPVSFANFLQILTQFYSVNLNIRFKEIIHKNSEEIAAAVLDTKEEEVEPAAEAAQLCSQRVTDQFRESQLFVFNKAITCADTV